MTQNPNFDWIFGKILLSWIRNNIQYLRKVLLIKLWKKYLFWTWETNIWLPDYTVRSTKVWNYQNVYVNVIIYISFYIKPLLLKIHPNAGQTPVIKTKGKTKETWLVLKGPPFERNLDFFSLSMKKYCNGGWTWHFFYWSQRKREITVTD